MPYTTETGKPPLRSIGTVRRASSRSRGCAMANPACSRRRSSPITPAPCGLVDSYEHCARARTVLSPVSSCSHYCLITVLTPNPAMHERTTQYCTRVNLKAQTYTTRVFRTQPNRNRRWSGSGSTPTASNPGEQVSATCGPRWVSFTPASSAASPPSRAQAGAIQPRPAPQAKAECGSATASGS